MDEQDLSATEKLVCDSFAEGRWVDLRSAKDPVVRASVVRRLLLGDGGPGAGQLAGLRLLGARIVGELNLSYADVDIPISLRECHVTDWLDLYGSRLRRLNLKGCTLAAGFTIANAEITSGMILEQAVVTGEVAMYGARIQGVLSLDGARLRALDASHLSVTSSLLARDGFVSEGGVKLGGAVIGGSLRLCEATVRNPGGQALNAPGMRVGGEVDLSKGFTAAGSVRLANSEIAGRLSVHDAVLSDPADFCLDLRNLVANEVNLRPRSAFPGPVDLSYARIALLHDDPATWPAEIALDGLVYQAIGGPAEVAERLRWLELDREGYRPQAYSQLAAMYQAAGRDDDARAVRYAAERRRSGRSRVWSNLQNMTVGYGYKPARAAVWLAGLLVAGTVLFSLVKPRAAEAAKAPEYNALAYTADLLLPVVDLGQQSNYHARGWTAWVAYALIAAGLVFVTTAAAGIARRLQRG